MNDIDRMIAAFNHKTERQERQAEMQIKLLERLTVALESIAETLKNPLDVYTRGHSDET